MWLWTGHRLTHTHHNLTNIKLSRWHALVILQLLLNLCEMYFRCAAYWKCQDTFTSSYNPCVFLRHVWKLKKHTHTRRLFPVSMWNRRQQRSWKCHRLKVFNGASRLKADRLYAGMEIRPECSLRALIIRASTKQAQWSTVMLESEYLT